MAYECRTAPVMLLSSVTEDGNFSGERASLLFQNQALQETVMDNILALMHKKGYVGLDVDFEYVEQKDATRFLGFLEYTASRLHAEGFFLHTDLAPKTSAAQAGAPLRSPQLWGNWQNIRHGAAYDLGMAVASTLAETIVQQGL